MLSHQAQFPLPRAQYNYEKFMTAFSVPVRPRSFELVCLPQLCGRCENMGLEKKFLKPLKFLQFSELARASSFLFAGILAGVLGYAFQIVVGRLLTVFEFGLFASIVTIVTIINAPVSS